jgi:hypothetical protein
MAKGSLGPILLKNSLVLRVSFLKFSSVTETLEFSTEAG